jgi:hypothetical protein
MTYFLHVVKTCKANGGTFYSTPTHISYYQSMFEEVTDEPDSKPK